MTCIGQKNTINIVFKPPMVWKIYYYFPFHFKQNMSPFKINLFILYKPKMSPFDRVTIWNETDYSFQIEFVTIWTGHHLKLFQTSHHFDLKMKISVFHTKHSYGDICHHMKTWSENFSYLSPQNPFIWWWLDQVYHSVYKGRHLAKFGWWVVVVRK